jgi:hypothetical protein
MGTTIESRMLRSSLRLYFVAAVFRPMAFGAALGEIWWRDPVTKPEGKTAPPKVVN